MKLELTVTARQRDFIAADADEVLFGGAAGGGKSHAQLIDALIDAIRYPGSRQLLLRRTYPELERSLIAGSLALYPREAARYLETKRCWRFENGSVIEFGHCAAEQDATRYQSAEYDL
ncbi:MAG: Terminase-like family protein, partial [Oscillospiraceae bacterium]